MSGVYRPKPQNENERSAQEAFGKRQQARHDKLWGATQERWAKEDRKRNKKSKWYNPFSW